VAYYDAVHAQSSSRWAKSGIAIHAAIPSSSTLTPLRSIGGFGARERAGGGARRCRRRRRDGAREKDAEARGGRRVVSRIDTYARGARADVRA